MPRDLKIIHIETGKNLYGGAKQVIYLLEGLIHRGFGKHILICDRDSPIYTHFYGKIKLYPEKIRGDGDILFLGKIISILRKERPSLLHIHSRRGADLWGWLGARIFNIPIIITRRVDNPEPPLWARKKYNSCVKVITISQMIAHILKKEGVKEEKILCIPSAIDPEEYKPHCHRNWFLKEFSLIPTNRTVAMIAQFIPRKGHHIFLKMASHLRKSHPEIIFMLFGKGRLKKHIETTIAKYNLKEKMRICGFREDMTRIIPCLDIVVHPAIMEGLGVSLLQASACEVPVIASQVGGIPEIIRHRENGILIEPGDWRGFYRAVKMLIENEKLRKDMGKKGREIVKRNFSIASMVDRYIQVYKKLMETSL